MLATLHFYAKTNIKKVCYATFATIAGLALTVLAFIMVGHQSQQQTAHNERIDVASAFDVSNLPITVSVIGQGSALLSVNVITGRIVRLEPSPGLMWCPQTRVDRTETVLYASDFGESVEVRELREALGSRLLISVGLASFAISGSGKEVCLVRSEASRPYAFGGSVPSGMVIDVVDVTTNAGTRLTRTPYSSIGSAFWQSDNEIVYLGRHVGDSASLRLFTLSRRKGVWGSEREIPNALGATDMVRKDSTHVWLIARASANGDGGQYIYEAIPAELREIGLRKSGKPLKLGYVWSLGSSRTGNTIAVVRDDGAFGNRELVILDANSGQTIRRISRKVMLKVAFEEK